MKIQQVYKNGVPFGPIIEVTETLWERMAATFKKNLRWVRHYDYFPDQKEHEDFLAEKDLVVNMGGKNEKVKNKKRVRKKKLSDEDSKS